MSDDRAMQAARFRGSKQVCHSPPLNGLRTSAGVLDDEGTVPAPGGPRMFLHKPP